MKQISIKNYFKQFPANFGETQRNKKSTPNEIELSSDTDVDQNKENHASNRSNQNKLVKIGGLVARLPAISRRNNDDESLYSTRRRPSKGDMNITNVSDIDEPDDELEIDNAKIDSEEYERKLMEAHGFYSNAAVCMLSWCDAKRKTIRQLEAQSFAIENDGERQLKILFGGAENSNEIGIGNSKKILRSPSSSSLENGENTKSRYRKPQNEDDQWKVEKLLSKRMVIENGVRTTHYYLKWKDWDYKYSSWEKHCKENSIDDLICKFDRRHRWREIIRNRVPAAEKVFFYNNYMTGSLLQCHHWEDQMNEIIKEAKHRQAPIYVENWVDNEARPRGFRFILENVFSTATEKAFRGIGDVVHCKCGIEGKKCGSSKNCCPENFGQNYCYMEDGTVNPRMAYKEWIVECTDACQCDINCPTRVVQQGRQVPIVVFRTTDRGWSVRTCVPVEKNTFVCEYLGEILTVDEALNSKKASTYQFQMDVGNSSQYKFIVDAAKFGNEARFINHSCNPNLVVRRIFADRLDMDYFRIAFFAKRDIKQGDELTLDYQAIDQCANGKRQKECCCKSKKCKGVFYY